MGEDEIEALAEVPVPAQAPPRRLWRAPGVVLAAAVAVAVAAAAVLVPPAAQTFTRFALAPALDGMATGSVRPANETRRYTVRRSVLRPAGDPCVTITNGTAYGSC